jgi:phospholipid/cholesterol/gamma-HCH transport system substrate-binding protein
VIRLLAPLAAGVVVVAIVAILLSSGGEEPYRLRLELTNASGLRDGSRVAVAGVDAGSVSLEVAGRRKVVAELEIEPDKGPVGKNANVQITALNLLGQKRVNLDKGNTQDPAPSGSTIPASRVSVTTDLDQIVSVLDGPTRARLGVLVNQAGLALYGRRMDLRVLAEELAPVLRKTTALLNDLTADNQSLGRVITTSDRFVASMAQERRSLAGLVRNAARASDVMAGRRAELAQTLERAPATLAAAQRFLAELEATAGPLGPAARELEATAPQLQRTLNEIDPVRRAATPALRTVTKVAPSLTRLGRGATPVLRRAVPVADRLASFTGSAVPVLRAVDGSIDNLVGTLENWARAIQFRDGLSHVFRGEGSITPDVLESVLNRLEASQRPKSKRRSPKGARRPTTLAPARDDGRNPDRPGVLKKVAPVIGELLDQLPGKAGDGLADELDGALGGLLGRSPEPRDSDTDLFDFLLGP